MTGDGYSAKDLRTWSATVLAAARLALAAPAPSSPAARRRTIATVIREVAEHLGNTPAVCRTSYVDPRVLDRFEHTQTIATELAAIEDDRTLRDALDRAVVALIEEHQVRTVAT